MPVDEELLKPSREHLAHLRAEIERQKELAHKDVEQYGYGEREYARQRWAEFHMTVAPLYREIEGVVKVMADYYGLQTTPSALVLSPGQALA